MPRNADASSWKKLGDFRFSIPWPAGKRKPLFAPACPPGRPACPGRNIFSGQKKTKIQLKNMAKDYIIKKSRCKRKVMCFYYDVKSDKKEVPL
jgi:hypothetical protein